MEDVHYLAWMFALNSYPAPHQTVAQQRAACVAICEGYGLSRPRRQHLVDGILKSQQQMLSHTRHADTAHWVESELNWTRVNRRALSPS